jgi:hypothetical protein
MNPVQEEAPEEVEAPAPVITREERIALIKAAQARTKAARAHAA